MAENLGDLVVSFSADLSELDKGLKSANDKVNEAALKIADNTKKIGLGITAAGAAIVGVFTLMIKSTAEYGEEIIKLSDRTGISTETLSRLKFVADQTNTSFEELANGLKFLSRNAEAAQTGNVKLKLTFDELGVKITDNNGKLRAADDIFLQVSDAFSKMNDGTLKTALAMQIFGRAGASLIPTLNLGSRGILELEKEADRLGITLTTANAEAIRKFNDGSKELKAAVGGLFLELSVNVIPALTKFIKGVTDVVVSVKDWTTQHPILTAAIEKTSLALGAVFLVVGPLVTAVGVLDAAFIKLGFSISTVGLNLLKVIPIAAAAMAGWKIGEIINNTHLLDDVLSGPNGLFTKAIQGWDAMTAKAKSYFGITDEHKDDWTGSRGVVAPGGQQEEQPNQDLGVLKIGAPRVASDEAAASDKKNIEDKEAQLTTLKNFYDAFDKGLIKADEDTNAQTLISFRQSIQEKAALVQTYNQLWQRAHAGMAAAANSFVTTLNTQLTTALTNILTGAQKAGDAFKAMGIAIVDAIIGYIVQQGVALALSTAMSGIIHATQLPLAAATAAEWAPAAALVSLATFGANSVPAAAAITGVGGIATALAASALKFSEGTDSVPSMLAPSEMVLPTSMASAIRAGKLSLSGPGGAGGNGDTNMTINLTAIINREVDVTAIAKEIAFQTNRELRYLRRA